MTINRASWLIGMLALLTPAAFGQFTVQGTVRDSLTHEPLFGANLFLKGTALGGVTDREGKFKITRVPAGTYMVRSSYVGYKPIEKPVALTADVTMNFDLLPDVIEGKEVVITAQMKGQVAAINQQINANTIVNVISEEKIKELPDANAAEAIGRLPGVSIIRSGGEANKVILRGMSDKFTSFTIDGIRIPSTDADSRGVDLSMFSQGTLAGVELFKALTPDKDADAIAGSINLVTKKAPSQRSIRVDAKGAYNRLNTNLGQYDFNGRYGERFFDDVLGVQVTANVERRDRSNEQFNTDIEDQRVFNSRGFLYDNLTLDFTDEIRKRSGASLLLDFDTPDSGSIKFNNIYSRTDRRFTLYNRDYPVDGSNVFYSARDREQNINTINSSLHGENNLFDLNITWGGSYAESKSELPYDYTLWFREPSILNPPAGMRGATTQQRLGPPELLIPLAYNNFQKATLDTGNFDTEKNSDREKTAYLDVAKKYVLGSDFTGEVKLGGKYRYRNRFKASTENFAPYYLNYYQDYVRNPDGSISRKNFAGTRFSNLQMDGRLVLFTNFLDVNPATRNMFGKYSLNPFLNRDALRDWYELNKNGVGPTGQSEYYGNPEVGGDYYDVIERNQAAYLMNTFNIGPAATLIAGVRVERESNDYNAKYVSTPLGGFPVTGFLLDTTATFTQTEWLPNVHFVVRPTDFMTVRLAAYRAIARPDFNARLEKMVARVVNPRNLLTIGNPRLKNAKSWNFEVNSSFFSNTIGLFSVSAFYREIDDMFHTVSGIFGNYNPGTRGSIMDTLGITWPLPFPAGSPISLTYSTNSQRPTKVWGFEVEHQANLNFLPGLLSNIVLSYNFSFVRSESYVLAFTIDTSYVIIGGIPFPQFSTRLFEAKQKLEGQPDFFGNVALGYDLGGFSGRLSVFFQGEYNRQYSANRRSDPVQKSFSRWDLALRQRVTDYLSFFINLNNLTNVEEDTYTISRLDNWQALRSSQRYGLTGDFGARLEF